MLPSKTCMHACKYTFPLSKVTYICYTLPCYLPPFFTLTFFHSLLPTLSPILRLLLPLFLPFPFLSPYKMRKQHTILSAYGTWNKALQYKHTKHNIIVQTTHIIPSLISANSNVKQLLQSHFIYYSKFHSTLLHV